MVNCFVPECYHRSDKSDDGNSGACTQFKSFPSDVILRRKWIQLVRRMDRQPHRTAAICSCHFVNGDTTLSPSIFPWNKKKAFNFVSPEKRKRRSKNSSFTEEVLIPEASAVGQTNDLHVLGAEPSADSLSTNTQEENDLEIDALVVEHSAHSSLIDTEEVTDFHTDALGMNPIGEALHAGKTLSAYENEIKLLTERIQQLEAENKMFKKSHLTFMRVTENEELCYHYTGLSSEAVYLLRDLLLKIRKKYSINSVKIIDYNDQLLLTLIRLRRNLSYADLAFRFGVSKSVVQLVFTSTLQVLHEVLFKHFMDEIPTREKNQMFTPECFNEYPNVMLVLDCTEIPCDVPQNMEKQKATYSNYKSTNTVKYAVGCAVNGSVIYCSPGYPGSTSDRAIVEHTNLLAHTRPGDMVMADKGFTISDLLPPGVSLNIPPFASNPQFTEDQVFQCRSKARSRIHIERINSRLKRFLICRYIPHKLFPSCDLIIQTCCALINLQSPIMKECSEFFKDLLATTNTS